MWEIMANQMVHFLLVAARVIAITIMTARGNLSASLGMGQNTSLVAEEMVKLATIIAQFAHLKHTSPLWGIMEIP